MTEYQFPPCVGCGYCCKKAPCVLGTQEFGMDAPCGGLVHRYGRFRCRIILEADGLRAKKLMKDLSRGAGCCSPLHTDRKYQLLSSSRSPEP